jgi:hypothetical protein
VTLTKYGVAVNGEVATVGNGARLVYPGLLPGGARREESDLEAVTIREAAALFSLSDRISGASPSRHFAGTGSATSLREYEIVAALSIASINFG